MPSTSNAGMPTYEDLVRRHRNQSSEEVFAHLGYAKDRDVTWQTPYERLAAMAKPEDWNFQRPEFKRDGQHFPILNNYLNYTFRRLQEQAKIVYSKDENRACFNTGLQTPNEQDIYATFFRNKQAQARRQPDWILFNFFDSYSEKLSEFRPLPYIATYVDNPADLVLDTSFEIEFNYEHLINENGDRLPGELKNNRRLAINAIRGSEELLKEKVARNYKVAIPHWYRGRIQLLLPLNLSEGPDADLALVAERDPSASLYRIRTALTMSMAYMNARLITRPDRDWLNP